MFCMIIFRIIFTVYLCSLLYDDLLICDSICLPEDFATYIIPSINIAGGLCPRVGDSVRRDCVRGNSVRGDYVRFPFMQIPMLCADIITLLYGPFIHSFIHI